MTVSEFINGARGMNEGKNFPQEFLTDIYSAICQPRGVRSRRSWLSRCAVDVREEFLGKFFPSFMRARR